MKLYYLGVEDTDNENTSELSYEDMINVTFLAVTFDNDVFYFIDPNNPNTLYYGPRSQILESMGYCLKEWTGRKIDSFHWRSFIIACFENLETV